MFVPLPAWMNDAADAIRQLADRPWTLFFLLLAMNAVGRPCSVTAHDARLYSLQAVNQAEHGAYAEDVFLRFGSQDQFSLFSKSVGPLVATIGLRPAFLLLYLVFNTLFIFALFRLIRTLIADPLIATLSLVYLTTASLSYGGHDIFTVHEQFFTPRIVAVPFTLLALEQILRRDRGQAARLLAAAGLLIAGALIHPLMACGGMMIWAGYVAITFLPTRVFVGSCIAATIGGVAILSVPAVGVRLFGEMDEHWHHLVRLAVGYNYPDTWHVNDWINLAASFAIPLVACITLYRDEPDRRRFFAVAILAGAVGFLTTLAASFLPYALLFQGQPYRVLWILKVFQVPLGFLLIARWSASPAFSLRLAAVGLMAFFCVQHYLPSEFLIFGVTLSIALCVSRVSEENGAGWRAAAYGLVLGGLGWMLYRCWCFVTQRDVIMTQWDVSEWVLLDLVSPIFWLVALGVGAAVWRRSSSAAPRSQAAEAAGWAFVAVAFLTPAALFAVEAAPQLREEHTRLGADMAFLRGFVKERGHARPPAIYCATGRPDLLWIDVGATSYFDIIQTAGVMFNRQTADEIGRRCSVAATFEMHRQRGEVAFLDDARKLGMENLFKIAFDSPAPTADDLIRLCQEPGLDYVVVPHEFPGLYSASNGRLFVYECYKCSRLQLSDRAEAPEYPALQRER